MSRQGMNKKLRTNRKLLAAWGALIAAVMASGALGYVLGGSYSPEPLVFNDEICQQLTGQDIWICQQNENMFLVIPLNR